MRDEQEGRGPGPLVNENTDEAARDDFDLRIVEMFATSRREHLENAPSYNETLLATPRPTNRWVVRPVFAAAGGETGGSAQMAALSGAKDTDGASPWQTHPTHDGRPGAPPPEACESTDRIRTRGNAR